MKSKRSVVRRTGGMSPACGRASRIPASLIGHVASGRGVGVSGAPGYGAYRVAIECTVPAPGAALAELEVASDAAAIALRLPVEEREDDRHVLA